MKTLYWIAPLAFFAASGCKKETAATYYHGKWDVREQRYTSSDTDYTETLEAGVLTYTFMDGNSVRIVHTGITDINDTWQVQGSSQDSIVFGSGSTWAVQEKTAGRFKAKFYPTANAFFVFTLEK